MRREIKRCMQVGFMTLLVGCTSAATPEVSPRYLAAYAVSHRDYVIAKGGRVDVIGNPFAVPKADLELVVTNVLNTSHFGGRFKLAEEAIAGTPYRIVVAFNAELVTGNQSLCSRPPSPGAARADGQIHVQAAFCSSERLLSSTQGRVAASRLGDPGFRHLINLVGFELFPPVDDRTGDRGADFL